uniref:Uncharacterized protein n=1 Tax=Desulfomonile tiedjei TaxID=2358 RepID=A0A7C4ASY6_9BACT
MYWKWIIAAACMLIALNAAVVFAGEKRVDRLQFKGKSQQQASRRVAQQPPNPLPAPLHYRLRATPQTYKAWQKKNYWDDFDKFMRGPFHRESDLEYMLRTF